MSAQDTTLYCVGLPLANDRELTDSEREEIAREQRRLRRRAWSFAILPIFGYLPLVGLAATLAGPAAEDAVFIVGLTALLLASPILVLLARDSFRLARALRKGLATGRVQRFAGTLQPGLTVFDDAVARLVAQRAFRPEAETEQSLEVLADAALIWRVNGARTRRWTWAQCTTVTDTPEYAATAAEWVQPFTDPEGGTTWWNHRDMTAPERAELRAHISSAGKRFVVGLLVNAYILALIISGDWRESPWTFVPLMLIIAWADFRAFWAVPAVFRVRRDIRTGKVVIFRPGGESGEGDAAEMPGPAGPATEFLPFSRLTWTHDGQPAPWRKATRR